MAASFGTIPSSTLLGGDSKVSSTTSSSLSNTQIPDYFQQATYNMLQGGWNTAQLPFSGVTQQVAGLQPNQLQAQSNIAANQGMWEPYLNNGASGVQSGMSGSSLAASSPYYQQALNYDPSQAANPYMQNSNQMSQTSAYQPYAQAAGSMNAAGTQGYVANQGLNNNAATAYGGLAQMGASLGNLDQASNFAGAASQSASNGIGQYMNPYMGAASDYLAQQSALNLHNNIMPGVSNSFIQAGDFGGTRMGEFGNRAINDANTQLLGQQANLFNTGYNQAAANSQADQTRLTQLQNQVGSQALGQQQNYNTAASGMSNALNQQNQNYLTAGNQLGQTMLNQQTNLNNLGLGYSNAVKGDQTNQNALGTMAAQNAGANAANYTAIGTDMATNANSDYNRMITGGNALGAMGTQIQANAQKDATQLDAAGQEQQTNLQNAYNTAYTNQTNQVNYPWQQLTNFDALLKGINPALVPTATSTTSNQQLGYTTPSPLMQALGVATTGAGALASLAPYLPSLTS